LTRLTTPVTTSSIPTTSPTRSKLPHSNRPKDPNGDLQTTNPDTAGRIHSRWLSMLYPRLTLARSLLRDNGVIFVSIDDNEVHHLRLLMNEVFGEENFRNCIVVKRGIKNVQSQFEEVQSLSVGHEYLLCYSRSFDRKLPKLDKSHDAQKIGNGIRSGAAQSATP
jgi:adenine-specific DNA-methyltransferase